MTNFNTDYNTTELLDQELTIEQLEAVAGGGGTVVDPGFNGLPGIAEFIYEGMKVLIPVLQAAAGSNPAGGGY
jgi:hypothetical protein